MSATSHIVVETHWTDVTDVTNLADVTNTSGAVPIGGVDGRAANEPATGHDDGAYVLVAEQDPRAAGMLAAAMSRAGFSVEWAMDGLQALYALDRRRPGAVVLDLSLPAVSGYRLLHLLRHDPETRDLPVVVLSDESFQEAKAAMSELPDDFLALDTPPPAVAERLEMALWRRAQAPPARMHAA